MTRAGADITALLKLNADGFKTGIETSIESVEKFVASFKEIGANSVLVTKGFNAVLEAVNGLRTAIVGLETSAKSIKQFKTLAQGMNTAATAAQRLTAVAQRGGMGIEALNSIVATFQAGMESATINVNGLASAIRALNAQQTTNQQTITNTKTQYESIRQELLNVASSMNQMGLSMSEEQARMVYNTKNMNSEVHRMVSELLEFANTGIASFNSVNAEVNVLKAQLRDIRSAPILEVITEESKIAREAVLQFRGEFQVLAQGGVKAFNMIGTAIGDEILNLRRAKAELESLNITLRESQYNILKLKNNFNNPFDSGDRIRAVTEAIMENSVAIRENGAEKLRAMGYTGKLSIEEEKETATTEKNTQSHYRNANAMDRSSASANKLSTATGRLGKALSSLKMIGTMVGSMLAYNFAHKLLVATGETVHAKSEMEGYFKMLHFGQSEVDDFNKALDDTVRQFQRVNKYSLGETISSIGVEFNLSTEEMKKAMKVTSMITSEYLRAGRNANEASLAVKDVLQGQFQRLSRETGVKGEQLKEAGWSGDTTDVLGLMEALEKVGMSRNWDVFAEKANSLNDILTITQNRFGEWSADMVNVVQPSIVNAFNSIMSFAQGLSEALSGMWQWLNTDGWGQMAVKIGAIGTALLTVSQAFVMYRTNMRLVEASQLGLTKTIASLVLGLKGQEIAEIGVRNAIASKILGVKAETIAEGGVTRAIQEKITMDKLETVQQKLSTLASEQSSVASMKNSLEKKINSAVTKELITQEEALALEKELLTIQTEMQTGANTGLLASLYLLGTGEELAAGATIGLSEAMGILNGAFMLSPIGWITAGILGLASAFYVLSGGLDESWGKMKEFNEAMDSGYDYLKPYQQQMAKLEQENKTNTEEYRNLNSALAKNKELIQQGTAQRNRATEQYEGLNATLDSHLEKIMKQNHISQETIDHTSSLSKAVELGKDKYYSAMQVMSAQTKNFDRDSANLIKTMKSQKKTDEEVGESLASLSDHYSDLATHSYIANTTDDWWEWLWNSFYAGMDQFWIDWEKFWVNPNWGDATKMLSETLGTLIPWTHLFDGIEEKGLVGLLQDAFAEGSDFDQFVDLLDTMVAKPIEDWINWFVQDPVAHFDQITDDLSLGVAKFLFGNDTNSSIKDMVDQWFRDSIIQPVQDSINEFLTDPLKFIGEGKFEFGGIGVLTSILPKLLFGEDANLISIGEQIQAFFESLPDPVQMFVDWLFGVNVDANWVDQGIDTYIIQPLYSLGDRVMECIQNIATYDYMGEFISYWSLEDFDWGAWVQTNIIDPLVSAIQNGVANTPILGDIAGLLGWVDTDPTVEAESKGNEIGTGFTTGTEQGLLPIPDIINNAFSSFDLSGITSMFTSNTQLMTDNASVTASNVSGSFNTMKSNQKSALDTMVSNNNTSFTNIKTNTNTQLSQMRDSTSNVTKQMTDAWSSMKDSIIASAQKIKSDSESRFKSLSDTIGGFYRKIQNPSLWGSAGSTSLRSGTPRPSFGRSVARSIRPNGYAGGLGGYNKNTTMTVSQLKRQICPTGDCSIFDGYNSSDVINVQQFLSSVQGEHGFGGWNFASSHYNHIKTKSDAWNTAPPIIQLLGGIATNTGFKVGEFNNGTPQVSFSTFQDIATAIFSRIPYRLYFDSSWKGSWLGALQAGACNCYDGALALMALAQTFGFSASMSHGTWTDPDGTKTAHVWAVINGVKMDTTGMQQRGTWNPSASAGGSPTPSNAKTPVNITINMGDVYGIDDLNNQIAEGIDKGLQKHFNKSYSLGV